MHDADPDPGPAALRPVEPVRRTSEIEDVTNAVFVHAISNRLTPVLARLRVRPNAVSLAGMACGVAAGWAYYHADNPASVVAGFLLMLAWHVMDGTDGQLARLTNTKSDTGKILDGICDYVTFAAVYLALALRLGRQDGSWVWAVVIAAGLCHALQSAAYERQREDYDLWGWGRGSDGDGRTASRDPVAGAPRLLRLAHAINRHGQSLAVVAPRDRERLDELLRSEPNGAALLRRRYRETFARPIRRWSVLSANYRTIGIFLFTLLHGPLFYFVFEIVVLSVVLAVLAIGQRARLARFVSGQLAPV